MMTFRELTQIEFMLYVKSALPQLADEISKAKGISPDEASKAAEVSFTSLFPGWNVNSQDQHVCAIVDGGRDIGFIHFGIRRDCGNPYVYLWDLFINPDSRGRGYGSQAMVVLKENVKELGHSSIRLNVFGHNDRAIRLYQSSGFRAESIVMIG